ncbi:hydrolase [Oenococcus oeni]|uniref:glycoside hydrolase family 70 protein n=1 Tax=Oenococcus oeni TaxID=1247 RepID=UPI0008F8123E|nr:glycoside hydrolase family 70 protein [Oenococcus oeni]OIL69921.1 hydrolase [Oenococcus oeni]OIM48500.1 hydrolase [Oenococcus oeni]OLQ36487.1 hydrolase [Oenococcus oeni]
MRDGDKIVRKKLYKSGKNFVIASIISVVGIGLTTIPASADSSINNAATVNAVQIQATKQDDSKVDTNGQTTANGNQKNTDTTTTPTQALTKTSQTTTGNNQTTDNDNQQNSNNTKTVAVTEQTQATKQAADSNIANQASTGSTRQDSIEEKTDVSEQTKKVVSKSDATNSAINTSSQQVYSSKNIKVIDGKTYYVDDNGQIKKNFATIINGKVLYFDKNTGELLPTNSYQFKSGLSSENSDYTSHNAVNSTQADDYTAIDGYLTADSWYRPKDILDNGQTWTAASKDDLRPLLMSLWPDKTTQVNYLNYMKNLGLSDSPTNFTNDENQGRLSKAAENVQVKIERKITQEGQTQWLKEVITNFVKSQPNWNISSESQTSGNGKDHLQGGALLYVNNDKTPDANSDYRLLNRTPTNQTGTPLYSIDPTQGGYDFLLANDVDNSNPVVQAEQLNWMYYLLNFGSITGNESNANFDSIRVDAVDNVDADLLQIAADYFKAAYGVDQNDAKADQHVSILEDWSDNDSEYVKDQGSNQLSMDNKMRLSLKYSLTIPVVDKESNKRSGLEPLISNNLVNRSEDSSTNGAQPNYSFVRAHDSEVQTVIAEIIKEKIDPDSDSLTPTIDQLTAAFKIYDADQLKTRKEFTQYNIPSTYAMILTNKDTVPRVYYGDLYTDDGQYMANKSPYYDSIDNLLKSRIKYVTGGQSMSIQYVQGDGSMAKDSYRGVLTSVRYGKDAMNEKDQGTQETRTEGLAVIESNNPDLKLSSSDQIVINMGAAHKNQAYRPMLLTKTNGLASYQSDESVPVNEIRYTNADGQLIFTSEDIIGTANPQVSGYLAVWVPVDAKDTQDARSQSSDQSTNDGQILHSNAALDSQVIYESFSNFQSLPTKTSEYENVKIAENTDLFNSWGITNFEFPPQYRSSTDNSFLDSIVQNGYAFTDRYDLGFNTPTKYGTVDQLRTSLIALHKAGIKAMADWVPYQIYNLTGMQIVTAKRVNDSGIYDQDSVINDSLYAAQTKGGGTYQAMYGGAFLDKIKEMYPDLFQMNQISTGVPIDPNEKIKEWSAKYFNGSNIQGRGAYYVLKDWASNSYFKVGSDNSTDVFLPKQLLNEPSNTGFISDSQGINYYSTSGYEAKNTFIEDENENWYYFGEDGYMKYGLQTVNNNRYYFLPNGIELQDAYLEDGEGNIYYFNQLGKEVENDYFMDKEKQWRYFDKNGVMANKGLATIVINGIEHTQYFGQDGIQAKGKAVKDNNGKLRYFASDSGDMVFNRFEKIADNTWAYFAADGVAVTGLQKISGQTLYFDEDGQQIKGKEAKDSDGKMRYFDADSGEMITNRYEKLSDDSWAYFAADGVTLTGDQLVDGIQVHFDNDGRQIKGKEVIDADENSGQLAKKRFADLGNNTWAYFNANGIAVTGSQIINGQHLYFQNNSNQIKGHEYTDANGKMRYFDADSGEMIVNVLKDYRMTPGLILALTELQLQDHN